MGPTKTKKSQSIQKVNISFDTDNKYDELSSLGSRAYNKEQENLTLIVLLVWRTTVKTMIIEILLGLTCISWRVFQLWHT